MYFATSTARGEVGVITSGGSWRQLPLGLGQTAVFQLGGLLEVILPLAAIL